MAPWTAAVAGWQNWLTILRLQQDLMTVAVGAPVVIALRMAKAQKGAGKAGFAFDPEWQRMVSEKVLAATMAQTALLRYATHAAGKPFDAAAALAAGARSVSPYGRKVRANVRRLQR